MPFSCSICGEESTRICARCTKDACSNHICDKCLKCSDCCECEVTLETPVQEPARTAFHHADASPVHSVAVEVPAEATPPVADPEPQASGEPDPGPILP